MRFDVLTLFPGMFASPLGASIPARAMRNGLLEVELHDIRAYASGRHQSVDDTPYGGGGGMVMTPGPLVAAIEAVKAARAPRRVIALGPQGRRFDQRVAVELGGLERVMLICGRYEGIDERVLEGWVDEELSIGDYVLSGGEPAAMVVIDAVTRLLPGALGNELGAWEESYSDGCLEHPLYTRPRVFRGREVPEVLLSGDHAQVARWRRAAALSRTRARRPDLFATLPLDEDDERLLAETESEPRVEAEGEPREPRTFPGTGRGSPNVYVALVHYPVYNKRRDKVATALTNLDIHDLARLGRTFGVRRTYMVSPIAAQRGLAQRIVSHWIEGEGPARNPRRCEAMRRVGVAADLEEVRGEIERLEGRTPKVVATGAGFGADALGYAAARAQLRREGEPPWLLLFGTGWGLHEEIVAQCELKLAPIFGVDSYNHLAVRTATGIILDRLLAEDDGKYGA